jgi:hypothetical protein
MDASEVAPKEVGPRQAWSTRFCRQHR